MSPEKIFVENTKNKTNELDNSFNNLNLLNLQKEKEQNKQYLNSLLQQVYLLLNCSILDERKKIKEKIRNSTSK